jgi:hypothetical protein
MDKSRGNGWTLKFDMMMRSYAPKSIKRIGFTLKGYFFILVYSNQMYSILGLAPDMDFLPIAWMESFTMEPGVMSTAPSARWVESLVISIR